MATVTEVGNTLSPERPGGSMKDIDSGIVAHYLTALLESVSNEVSFLMSCIFQ